MRLSIIIGSLPPNVQERLFDLAASDPAAYDAILRQLHAKVTAAAAGDGAAFAAAVRDERETVDALLAADAAEALAA